MMDFEDGAGNAIGNFTDGAGDQLSDLYRVQADDSLEHVWTLETAPTGDINLAPEVPDRARTIQQEAPDDIREDLSYPVVSASGYDGRSGDLTEAIEDASQNGEILDLGDGTYEMQTGVSNTGDILAIAGDGAEIYFSQLFDPYEIGFPIGGEDEVYLQDLVFDVTEGDNALLTTYNTGISDYCLLEDIELRGQRRAPWTGSYDIGILLQMGPGGESFVNRVDMLDGERPDWDGDDFDRSIAINADSVHEGYNVFRQVNLRDWHSNGFYVQNSPGENVLWDCSAVNIGRVGMRIGEGDIIVGGLAETNEDHAEEGMLSSPVGSNNDEWDYIAGLTVICEGDRWGGSGLRVWTGGSDDTVPEGGEIRDSTFHFRSGNSPPFRVDSVAHAEIPMSRCWILDETGGSNTFAISTVSNDPGTVTVDGDVQMDSNSSVGFRMGSNGTLIDPSGTNHSDTTVNASDIGIDATLTADDFPTYYFDFDE